MFLRAAIGRVYAILSGRSGAWPTIRDAYLADYPTCAACGSTRRLQVHHVVPVSVDPSRELDLTNLLTLCVDGPGRMNCHLVVGHGGDWTAYNPTARDDANRFRRMLSGRVR